MKTNFIRSSATLLIRLMLICKKIFKILLEIPLQLLYNELILFIRRENYF